jgi:hypothetical protein
VKVTLSGNGEIQKLRWRENEKLEQTGQAGGILEY